MRATSKPLPRTRSRRAGKRFEVGGQWLGQENGIWHRYWYDTGDGRGRRKSLGTRDVEEAKMELFKIVMAEPADDPTAPDATLLAQVFAHYVEHSRSAGLSNANRSFD
jgi:hypothetical protein